MTMKLWDAYQYFKRRRYPMAPMYRRPIKPPCVIKVNVESTEHKTEKGLVKVVYTEGDLKKAQQQLSKKGSLLYQPLVHGLEVFVGTKHDPNFGPMVLAGLGGIYLEVFRDVGVRLAPLDKVEAEEMIKDTYLWEVLHHRKKLPIEPLINLIERVSRIADRFSSLDFNPVFIHEKGVQIVDVRVVL